MHSVTFCEGTWGSHGHCATQAPFRGSCRGGHSWPTASNCYIFRTKPHSCPSCPGGSQPATSHQGVWSWAISNWHQTPLNWQLLLGLAIAFSELCWSLRSLPFSFLPCVSSQMNPKLLQPLRPASSLCPSEPHPEAASEYVLVFDS